MIPERLKGQLLKAIDPLTNIAWGLSAIASATVLLGMRGLGFWVVLLLLGLSLMALAWLVVRYNRVLAQWRSVAVIWTIYFLARMLSVRLQISEITFARQNLAVFALLLAIDATLVGWFALLVLVIRRDVSFAYIVIFFAIGAPLMRMMVISAGGVLGFVERHLAREPLGSFSLIEPVILSFPCMALLGFIALPLHLVRLLIREATEPQSRLRKTQT